MENIFKKIGYNLSSSNEKRNLEEIKWLQINNPDGTARWIWNVTNKQPIFLKFYNEGSIRAKIFALLIKTVFIFKLQKLLFKQSTFYIEKNNNLRRKINEELNKHKLLIERNNDLNKQIEFYY